MVGYRVIQKQFEIANSCFSSPLTKWWGRRYTNTTMGWSKTKDISINYATEEHWQFLFNPPEALYCLYYACLLNAEFKGRVVSSSYNKIIPNTVIPNFSVTESLKF